MAEIRPNQHLRKINYPKSTLLRILLLFFLGEGEARFSSKLQARGNSVQGNGGLRPKELDSRLFALRVASFFPGNATRGDMLALAVRYEQLAYLKATLAKERKRVADAEAKLRDISGKKTQNRNHYAGWEADSDDWWVDFIKRDRNWTTTDNLEGIPGTTLLSDKTSFSCMLVVKDVCHFSYDRDDGGFGGYWYSPKNYDLSRLLQLKDACGWAQRYNVEPVREVSRIRFNMGEFISSQGFEKLSVPPNKASFEDVPILQFDQGMASPHDSNPGHFIERVGPLAELAGSLAKALKRPANEPIFANMTIVFGSNNWIRTFARGVTKILFGDIVKYTTGKRRPGNAHACFKEVIYPLNHEFVGGPSSERFKQNAHKLVSDAYMGVPQVPKLEPNYQITWLWRSSSRLIVNAHEVLHLLESVFTGIPIQMLEFGNKQPLIEIIDTMRRTAFTFGMHGASFSNEIFLPSGSTALELLPWKMTYQFYESIGTRFGVQWQQWQNRHFENTVFSKNCFQSEWMAWSAGECLADLSCYHCIKNHSNTRVDLSELEDKLREIEPRVRNWIANQRAADIVSQ